MLDDQEERSLESKGRPLAAGGDNRLPRKQPGLIEGRVPCLQRGLRVPLRAQPAVDWSNCKEKK
ncbi:hypothetical protein [Melaminivora jejuensis]|uniref:hypothetical protein n=1 Tax=Melaminivora jejuensis TaxID=1267217 RepID=UPI001ADF4A1B|nr:hypothetical protein [Melaminivora jejuensis]UHJ65597.1 hypothetical protein LVC68_03490 [Melaminivora jejuensis]